MSSVIHFYSREPAWFRVSALYSLMYELFAPHDWDA